MIQDGETEKRLRTLSLDRTLLELDPEEEAFFKTEIGIQDAEELRKHIIEVQEEAYKVGRCSHADSFVHQIWDSNIWIVFRSTRTLAFVGSDSRRSRSPVSLRIHGSLNWRRTDQTRYSWILDAAVRAISYPKFASITSPILSLLDSWY